MTVVRHAPPSLLVERALDYLRAGPAPATELIAHVCQMGGVPSLVAEEMANALFATRREFVRAREGHWMLAGASELRARSPGATELQAMSPGATLAHTMSPGATQASTMSPGAAERHAMPSHPTSGLLVPDGAAPPMSVRERRAPYPAAGASWPAREMPLRHPPLTHLPYVVIDVETTGGRAMAGDRITEVAAVVIRDGRVDEVFETLVNPQRSIPPWITALTNISWSMVKDAPTFREIAPRLLELLEGRIFVAHNATFDWRFICAEVERATGERLSGERLCTVRLARRLLPQLRRRSLDYVCDHYGVENAARHRAGGDAIATAHVFLRLLGDAAGRGVTTWDELRALVDARTGRAKRRRRPSAMPRPVDKDTTA